MMCQEPDLCATCIAKRLGLTSEGVLAALEAVSKTLSVSQTVQRCAFCGQTRWVVSLSPPSA